MKPLKTFDLEAVCQELPDAKIKKINKSLILDGAYGFQSAVEGILFDEEFIDATQSEYQACEAGIVNALQSVNKVMKNLGIEFEIVEVDLADTMGWMMVAKGMTPKLLAKKLKAA
jgi:hypothetical protein